MSNCFTKKISVMKKKINASLTLFLVLILSGTLLMPSCSNPKKEAPPVTTTLGVFTPYSFFPETLNGKVKTVKEVNYWANDNSGTITAGDRISIAARDTFNWTNDILVSFDPEGNIEKCVFLDENDKPFGEWDVEMQDGKMAKAKWLANDTTKNYIDIAHPDENTIEMKRYNAETDTLRNSSTIKLDTDGKLMSVQFFNYKDEPLNEFKFSYGPDGKLDNYAISRDDTVRGGMNFHFNEEGFAQSQEVYNTSNDKKESYIYNYTYDDQGNWTGYTGYKDGKPIVICKRTYTYYEE